MKALGGSNPPSSAIIRDLCHRQRLWNSASASSGAARRVTLTGYAAELNRTRSVLPLGCGKARMCLRLASSSGRGGRLKFTSHTAHHQPPLLSVSPYWWNLWGRRQCGSVSAMRTRSINDISVLGFRSCTMLAGRQPWRKSLHGGGWPCWSHPADRFDPDVSHTPTPSCSGCNREKMDVVDHHPAGDIDD